jgi:hypothetical protein
LQAPDPSQELLPPQLSSSWLVTSVVQVPLEFAHERQGVLQPLEQHLPSRQMPRAQAPEASQVLFPLQLSSSALATSVVQVPFEFAHERQGVLQPVEQHLPSRQLPLAHSPSVSQSCPRSSRHAPDALHVLLPLQLLSSALLTTVLHAPLEFAHERHAVVQPLAQHVASTQLPLAHWLPVPQDSPSLSLHAPEASQMSFPLQLSSVPLDTTVVQVPFEFAQERQAVVQSSAQQVLSTQLPLTHWASALHDWPSSRLQSPEASHVLFPLQLSSSALETTVVQVPLALPQERQAVEQVLEQQRPSRQKPVAQRASLLPQV